jgi:LAO/AO transport system kinase
MSAHWEKHINEMQKGSVLSLARLITLVENRESGWLDAMKRIHQETGKAKRIGITGSPGVGKSTLTNSITRSLVERGHQVGVIAVDPSSPFSGGSLLGDRIRMRDVSGLDGVFIRSMATRGALGGLNQSACDVANILDAFGKDIILIETVGVGQDEIEVVKAADLVLVVLTPGQGDGIQALKAGIMEIADVFVVNKADHQEVEQVILDIQVMLELGSDHDSPIPPIVKTVANKHEGVPALVETTLKLLRSKHRQAGWQQKQITEELIGLTQNQIINLFQKKWQKDDHFDRVVQQILSKEKDPYTAVSELLAPLISCINEKAKGFS